MFFSSVPKAAKKSNLQYMNIIKHKKISFVVSGALFLTSVVLLFTIGLKPGIDFTGGSLLEVSFTESRPSIDEVSQSLAHLDLGELQVQPAGEDHMILRFRYITEDEHQTILSALRDAFPAEAQPSVENSDAAVDEETTGVTIETEEGEVMVIEDALVAPTTPVVIEERLETIGPSISAHLKERALEIGIVVLLAIILFIAYAFRKVSKPVSSWKFGIIAIIALVHDVMITVGVFVLLGHYFNVEVNIPFIVALLTILGYSVNDTIVVFDRIRENLIKMGYQKFEEVVHTGVSQTLLRSFNTSFTTLLVLFTLFLFGGETIKYFALALIIGIGVGTYSSIFLASPLLVVWERWKRK
ncbi:MAG: Protein-export membrane protein SecD [Candidatus Magasanikbacteria bacterium GW2011_GWD2_43_18]|nr:MAG: Protein-export membrane protein SecD [Candidatus Magasanikbacteria bacterium GW2011_GWD2_43_18]